MKNRVLVIGAVVFGLLTVTSGEAFAAFRTYLLVPGIPGESTDLQHQDWIEVLSLSQGASAAKKAVACTDLFIAKNLDRSGPPLWAAAAVGQVFPEIQLQLVKEGATNFLVYDIKITNAKVTSINTAGSSELPTEFVSFSYQSLTLTFNRQSPTGGIIPGIPQTIACQ